MSGGFISSLFKKKAEEEEPSKLGLARVIKYEELKKATNYFNTELGNGGFGRVYLGKLRDGQMVAVKVLFDRNPKRLEQFFNEVTVLSRLRHKNLVSLYGCTNPRSQELLLVYEYVPNGTVADHLHGRRSYLNWALRVRIAVETAEALSYLHALQPPIIHRDVKTSNILLDNAFHIKLADLGICRLLPYDTTHVTTMPQGTLGYRDPEYEQYFRLTDRTDVYSFGVVLMELILGQQAVDVDRDPEDIYLDDMVRNRVLNKKLGELVDSKLAYHSNDDIKRMINLVAELAMECLQPKGDMRPPMVQVVTVLKGIQNEMQQIGLNDVDLISFGPQQELGDGSLSNGQDRETSNSIAFRDRPPRMVLPMEIPAITLAELNRLTSDFVQKALIGEGSYCRVFYAVLRTGEPAAIKKLVPNASQDPNSDFTAKLMQLSTVSRLKHENFVQLLGYCFEANNRMLVYQFATKGSLHDILHGKKGVRGASPGPVLSWSQRVNIALGVARGLEYLHQKVQPPIVHEDVRSSKILLSDDYNPKIGDFYLTREYPHFRDYPDPPSLIESGYHAPEYRLTEQHTHRSNTYSFGVILLELLTGREPIPRTSLKRLPYLLVNWAKPRLSEDKVQECVDPRLNNEYPPKAAAKMGAIAACCIQDEPDYRPDMSVIVKALVPLCRKSPMSS